MIQGTSNGYCRNGMGYSDPTAYIAEKNIKEKKIMSVYEGSIWKSRDTKGITKKYLVLRTLSQHAMCLEVRTNYADNCVMVDDGYVSPAYITTKKYYALDQHVGTLDKETFTKVRKAIAKSLGLEEFIVEKVVEMESPVTPEPTPLTPLEALQLRNAERERKLKEQQEAAQREAERAELEDLRMFVAEMMAKESEVE